MSSARWPVKLAMSRGSARVAAATKAPASAFCRAASTSLAGARPRAADTKSSLASAGRPSAMARSRAVSLWAVRLTPRSRSLTARVLIPAASASSSWVSRAPVRSCRSKPAKLSPRSSATSPASPHAACHRRGILAPNSKQPGPPLLAPLTQPGPAFTTNSARSGAQDPDPLTHGSGSCGLSCGRSRVVSPAVTSERGNQPRYQPSRGHQYQAARPDALRR